jgi:adenylate kinase family enzyme
MAGVLELPLYHLDMIWHKPDKTTISKDEFDKKLDEILQQDSWIIDGNFQRTIEKRIAAATAIILLDMPTELCLKNARDRIGKPREDMPWIEIELDPEFEKEIRNFKDVKLPKIYQLLDNYNDGTRIIRIFRTRAEIRDFALNDLFGMNIHD